MFKATTARLQQLAQLFPQRITELERLLLGRTNIYIDYANVLHWSKKLGWKINLKRFKQFFSSFSQVQQLNLYYGTLQGSPNSELLLRQADALGYRVITKPVKVMYLSIDVRRTPKNSKRVLSNLVKSPLLHYCKPAVIQCLNQQLLELNQSGISRLRLLKCNFDVEIGRDMLLDFSRDEANTFVLMSGDSDFAEPVQQLLIDNKQVVIAATARRVSVELGRTGAKIFDIAKIKNFICFSREISKEDS